MFCGVTSVGSGQDVLNALYSGAIDAVSPNARYGAACVARCGARRLVFRVRCYGKRVLVRHACVAAVAGMSRDAAAFVRPPTALLALLFST